MVIKLITIILVSIGTTCLSIAILPTRRICSLDKKHRFAWRYLGTLILLFLVGYLYYGSQLLFRPVQIHDLLISIIMVTGGFFVILVTRLSLQTLKGIKKIADRERHRALHDELTELPNRTLLYERIEQAMLEAKRDETTIAIMLMDLNRFKEINDTLGHFYGDYLLQMIAPRMWECIRQADTIARFGGDEFAVVLPGVELEQAVNIAEKITRAMEEPFHIEGNSMSIDVSIGIALYPRHGTDSDTLLQHADIALYAAKKTDGAFYSIYNAELDDHSMKRLMFTVELREALKKEQLVLHYQPKYSLINRQVCGVEALVRWPRTDGKGLTAPADFIPIAEKTGLIRLLTYQVLDKAFAQSAEWKKRDIFLPMAINLSTKVLHDLDLPGHVKTLLEKWEIDPRTITLEITESSMVANPVLAFKTITALGELGVHISIDDFGTGYSSLALLKRLPGGELKIDKSLIMAMAENRNDLTIVQSSIDLARSMNLQVVAEGVETRETLEKLTELHCEMAQGFYLSPPLPAAEVLTKIAELNTEPHPAEAIDNRGHRLIPDPGLPADLSPARNPS